MKYYRVYAQCVRRPRGMAIEKIDRKTAEDEIFSTIFEYDGTLTQELNEALEEDDQQRIEKEHNRLYEKAIEFFEEKGTWGCGDYQIQMVEDDEDSPSRPNSCGNDVSFLTE